MTQKECGYTPECGKKEPCFLKGTTQRQADLGGNPAEVDAHITSRGPYWTRSAWSNFTSRVINMADSSGCLFKDGMATHVDQVTEGKEKKGEFI